MEKNRCRSRVTPETTTTTTTPSSRVRKELPNGDIYVGELVRKKPEGFGTYLWKDGTKYRGEWRNGKAYGKGEMLWASGASYEGDFKLGRMDGRGVLIGAGGDCYSGGWVCDRMDGDGEKWFVNGDYYSGGWRDGFMDGFGKYVWSDGGGFYFGEWRGGCVFGSGVLVLEGRVGKTVQECSFARDRAARCGAAGAPCAGDRGAAASCAGDRGAGALNLLGMMDEKCTSARAAGTPNLVGMMDKKCTFSRVGGAGTPCACVDASCGARARGAVASRGRAGIPNLLGMMDEKCTFASTGARGDGIPSLLGNTVQDCSFARAGVGRGADTPNLLGMMDEKCTFARAGALAGAGCESKEYDDGNKLGGVKLMKLDEKCAFVSEEGYKGGLWVCDRRDGKGEKWYKNDDWDCKSTKNDDEEMGFPRICIWESEGDAGYITCDIVGDGFSGLDSKVVKSPCSFIKEAKKPGSTISKGHKNYDLMLNLQLGIRYSVGKHSSMLGELTPKDFDPMEKFWTRFPPEGSKLTPTHKSNDFRWKDYCPVVFRHLRDLFQVDTADYMLAICGNHALRELSSPGKSGSFFYLTQDDRFMIKTVKKSEVKVLLRMLPSYYQHVYRYENTLVTRFYGVHCVKPAGGPKVRFIVMGNLFCSEYRIHRRFDLKGSRHGRTTKKAERDIDETTTLKDLDLDFVFRLQRNWYQELIKQIERDCEFLEAEKIMDYSLLVGIHFRNDNTMDKMGLSPFVRRGKKASYQNEKCLRGQRFLEAELQDMDRVLAGRKPLIRLGANMPARAERLGRRSDFDQYTPGGCGNLIPSRNGDFYEVILYFGIIDILQDYDISKKLEHAYKSLQADPTTISAVDPRLYSKRFRDFIGRIFVEDR